MDRKLFNYSVAGFFFVSIAGSLLHFAYDLSGSNPLAGMFTPVNESTWEHMKLIFFPSFFYLLAGWPLLGRTRPQFLPAFLTGTLVGTVSIPVIFYTYSGILGSNYLWLDLLTFYLSALLDYWLSFQMAVQKKGWFPPVTLLLFLNITFMVLFFLLTYRAPDAGIFAPPLAQQAHFPWYQH